MLFSSAWRRLCAQQDDELHERRKWCTCRTCRTCSPCRTWARETKQTKQTKITYHFDAIGCLYQSSNIFKTFVPKCINSFSQFLAFVCQSAVRGVLVVWVLMHLTAPVESLANARNHLQNNAARLTSHIVAAEFSKT